MQTHSNTESQTINHKTATSKTEQDWLAAGTPYVVSFGQGFMAAREPWATESAASARADKLIKSGRAAHTVNIYLLTP